MCLCEALPHKPLEISTTVYILQHPEEVYVLTFETGLIYAEDI